MQNRFLSKFLGESCTVSAYRFDGTRYLVTTGTGESIGVANSCFAYEADEVAEYLEGLEQEEYEAADYNDFCQHVNTVETRELAIHLVRQSGQRLVRGGSCQAVLSEAEYDEAMG